MEERVPWIQSSEGSEATIFHPDIPVWGPGSWVHSRFQLSTPSIWFVPPVLCPGLEQCVGAEQSGVVGEHLFGSEWNGEIRCAHGRHAPVSLDLTPTSFVFGTSRTRSFAASTTRAGTGWPRGSGEQGLGCCGRRLRAGGRGLRRGWRVPLDQRLVAGPVQADVLVEAGVELARDRELDGDGVAALLRAVQSISITSPDATR